jgi:hypothetical protein
MTRETPLITALLACDIAGVGFDPNFGGSEAETPQAGFLIESELTPSVTLSIEHLDASAAFIVRSDAAVEAGRRPEAMRIALQLNHVAAETDLFSVNPLSSALIFTRRLPLEKLDLTDLALAVRTATEVGLSLSRCEIPGILFEAAQEAVSEFTSDISVIRG